MRGHCLTIAAVAEPRNRPPGVAVEVELLAQEKQKKLIPGEWATTIVDSEVQEEDLYRSGEALQQLDHCSRSLFAGKLREYFLWRKGFAAAAPADVVVAVVVPVAARRKPYP